MSTRPSFELNGSSRFDHDPSGSKARLSMLGARCRTMNDKRTTWCRTVQMYLLDPLSLVHAFPLCHSREGSDHLARARRGLRVDEHSKVSGMYVLTMKYHFVLVSDCPWHCGLSLTSSRDLFVRRNVRGGK